MAKFELLHKESPRVYQLVTDGGECEPLMLGKHSKVLLEVRGNDTGKPVEFRGSLDGEPRSLLGIVRGVDDIIELPPVRFLKASCEAAGVTINFMGVE